MGNGGERKKAGKEGLNEFEKYFGLSPHQAVSRDTAGRSGHHCIGEWHQKKQAQLKFVPPRHQLTYASYSYQQRRARSIETAGSSERSTLP